MKTYKEINEGIELPDELKQKTLQAMTLEKARHRHIFRYAGAFMMMIVCVGGVWLSQQSFQEDEQGSSNMALSHELEKKKSRFDINAYMFTNNNKTGTAQSTADIAGEVSQMNATLREEMKGIIPELSQLVIPSGFQSKIDYMQYEYPENHSGPYAQVNYQLTKGEYESIDVTMQDERIPRCLPFEDFKGDDVPQYKDYKLSIIKKDRNMEGYLEYYVSAYREGYTIEISANIETEEAFSIFLESFLI